MDNIKSLLEKVDAIAAGDCGGAIDYLLQNKNVKQFVPWGYLKLADLRQRCGDHDKQFDILIGLMLDHKIPAVMSKILDFLRLRHEDSNLYRYVLKGVCQEVVKYCLCHQNMPDWFKKI